MFNNAGKKLIDIAKVFFWIDVIGWAIIMLYIADIYYYRTGVMLLAYAIIICSLYIGTLGIVAYGQKAEDTRAICESLEKLPELLCTQNATLAVSPQKDKPKFTSQCRPDTNPLQEAETGLVISNQLPKL